MPDAELDRVSKRVDEQSAQLHKAINTITEVATLQKQEALARQEDRVEFKEMVASVNKLTLQVSLIADIKDQLGRHEKDISNVRHDNVNISDAGTKMALLLKETMDKQNIMQLEETKQRSDIDNLLKWHDRVREQEQAAAVLLAEKTGEDKGAKATQRRFWQIVSGAAAVIGTLIGWAAGFMR